jgi:hypothetical protein
MSEMKRKVVVSRKWNNPEITVSYDSEGIYIFTSADDFLTGLLKEYTALKSKWYKRLVNWHYPSEAKMRDLMSQALKKVEEEMKMATIHFPPPGDRP